MLRAICCLLVSAFVANAAPDTTALYAWLKRQPSIRTLEASFSQERTMKSLKQPVVTPGKLAFERPDHMRWELGNPPQTIALSDGQTLTLLDVAEKTARQMAADSPRARQFSIIAGRAFQNVEGFEASFEVVEQRVVAGFHQYTLKPKDAKLRADVPWVFLDIEPESNELRVLDFQLSDRSRVRTIFTRIAINPKLAAGTFQPNLEGFQVK